MGIASVGAEGGILGSCGLLGVGEFLPRRVSFCDLAEWTGRVFVVMGFGVGWGHCSMGFVCLIDVAGL